MHDGSSDPTEECHICGEICPYDYLTFCEECGKAYCESCYSDESPCKACDTCGAVKCRVSSRSGESMNNCYECLEEEY